MRWQTVLSITMATIASACAGQVEPVSSGPNELASLPVQSDNASSAGNSSSQANDSGSSSSGVPVPTAANEANSACTLPAATLQSLLNRWNAAGAAVQPSIDFTWGQCDQFPHPTFKGGTVEAYRDFTAVLLQFFNEGDNFAFLSNNHLFETHLLYVFPSGEIGMDTSFEQLTAQASSGVSLFSSLPSSVTQPLAAYLAKMN